MNNQMRTDLISFKKNAPRILYGARFNFGRTDKIRTCDQPTLLLAYGCGAAVVLRAARMPY